MTSINPKAPWGKNDTLTVIVLIPNLKCPSHTPCHNYLTLVTQRGPIKKKKKKKIGQEGSHTKGFGPNPQCPLFSSGAQITSLSQFSSHELVISSTLPVKISICQKKNH